MPPFYVLSVFLLFYYHATAAVDLSPFGVSSSAQSTGTYATWMPLMKQAGIKWGRLFPEWGNIEPKRGTFDFSSVDSLITSAIANDMSVSALFFYDAPWLNSNTHTFPSDLDAWSAYVSELVKHGKGNITYYEVWNEPQSFAQGGTTVDYANVVASAYKAAKNADPNAQIGITVAANDVNYLKQSILSGAESHYDYVIVHPYEITAAIPNGWEPVFMGITRTIQRMLAAADPSRVNASVWFTELGYQSSGSTADDAEQARVALKAFTMAVAQGVARLNWYEAKDGQGGFGLLRSDNSQRPIYGALRNLIMYIGSIPKYQGWVQINANKDYGFVFQGPTTSVLVLWEVVGQKDSVTFSANVRVLNPVTGMITSLNAGSSLALSADPVLILDVPSNVIAQAQHNKDLPFPWGGDYSKASSISATMGSPNTEEGLHQFNADVSSKPVVIYGSIARDCSVSASQEFTVDPNFSSYHPDPIRITTVTRRNEQNDNAGFNIVYEGPDGWKNFGTWYTVPGNDKWYTNTWTITDPQFVSIWGFNFRLSSDSTSNSKYYLQKVTVSKIFGPEIDITDKVVVN